MKIHSRFGLYLIAFAFVVAAIVATVARVGRSLEAPDGSNNQSEHISLHKDATSAKGRRALRNEEKSHRGRKDPPRVIGLSEEDLVARVSLKEGKLDEQSIIIVGNWIAKNQDIPISLFKLIDDRHQQVNLISMFINSAFDGYDVDPVLRAINLMNNEQAKTGVFRMLAAACVRNGNLDWPIRKAEELPPGSRSAAIFRSVVENATPSDVDRVAEMLRGLSDTTEAREAGLAFAYKYLPKLDKAQLERLKAANPGGEFEKFVDRELMKHLSAGELEGILLNRTREGGADVAGSAAMALARKDPDRLIRIVENSPALLGHNRLALVAGTMEQEGFENAIKLLEAVSTSDDKAQDVAFEVFRKAASRDSVKVSEWIRNHPDSKLADAGKMELVRFLAGNGAVQDARPYAESIRNSKWRVAALKLLADKP